MQADLEIVAGLLRDASPVVALTGAGISVDSGIPAFRGAQGLWERYDPMEYASIDAFRSDPGKVWRMLKEMDELVFRARPNAAHTALADLERIGALDLIVTQNVDGLHQLAGARRVVEFHGNCRTLVCLDCGRSFARHQVDMDHTPPACGCGGPIKPDVIFFGEMIPQRALLTAMEMARQARVMMVVGTSAVVAPASQLPLITKHAGGVVVEINPEPTLLTREISDYFFQANADEVLPRLVEALRAGGGAGSIREVDGAAVV